MTETIHANSGDLVAVFTWLYICAGIGSAAMMGAGLAAFFEAPSGAVGGLGCIAALFLFVALVIAMGVLYQYGVHP